MGSPEAGRPGHGEAGTEDRAVAATGRIADRLTTSVSSHMRMRLDRERNTSCQTTGPRHGRLDCNVMESPDQGVPQMSLGDSDGAPNMFSAELPVTTSLVSMARMTAPL